MGFISTAKYAENKVRAVEKPISKEAKNLAKAVVKQYKKANRQPKGDLSSWMHTDELAGSLRKSGLSGNNARSVALSARNLQTRGKRYRT